jgi:hypothetical protein
MVAHAGVWLLLLVSSWSHLGTSRAAPAQPHTHPHQTPTCDTAADLSYCRYPGPLLVVLTGLGNGMHSWPPAFVHALNRNAGALTYDRRGRGRSAALPPAPVTAAAAAADPRFQNRAALEPGSTDDWDNRGADAGHAAAPRAHPGHPTGNSATSIGIWASSWCSSSSAWRSASPFPTSPSGSSAGCLASDTGLFVAEDVVNLLISLYRLSPVWHTRRMKTIVPANPYKNHRFPEEILNHAVWLYFRFG